MTVQDAHQNRSIRALVRTLWKNVAQQDGTQIVEFALSLPILVLFVIGIFDFSNAITLKQKLTNAARDSARVAAADPANDLGNTGAVPVSVSDALQVVDNYLLSERMNDCGLLSGAYTQTQQTWTYTANGGGCPSTGITLTINRGCLTLENNVNVVGTCVAIRYPYQWQYGYVSSLFGPTLTLPTTVIGSAAAFNEN
jgi:Flp pilus assembly protein TadG